MEGTSMVEGLEKPSNISDELVLVSTSKDAWITAEQGRKICESLNKGTKYITVGGSVIATHTIRALLSAKDYMDNAKLKNFKWLCRHGTAHASSDTCTCGKITLPRPAPPAELDISDEERERNMARAQAMSEYIRSNLGDSKKLQDAAARNEFVKKRTDELVKARNTKEADKQ